MEEQTLGDNSKVEKVDLNAIKQERDENEFFAYTNSLLQDGYFLTQCEKYCKIKEEIDK